jgi:T5SS/PEP-CTERM-associated repeat protein
VAASGLSLAYAEGSSAEMTISGAGSEFAADDASAINQVGYKSRASIRIEDGGAARFSGDLYLGQSAGYSGATIEVVGAGSQLVADQIRLSGMTASAGDGLLVLDGGTVTATEIRVFGMNYGEGEIRGSGQIVGDLSVERGWLEVGNPIGRLQVDGNTSMEWKLLLEIAGPETAEYDQLAVTGDVDVTGAVYIEFIDGYEPQSGDFFDVITSGGTLSYAPASTIISGLNLPAEAELVTRVMSDRVRFEVVPEPAALLSQAVALLALFVKRRALPPRDWRDG